MSAILSRIFSHQPAFELEPALQALKFHTICGTDLTYSESVRQMHRNTAHRIAQLLNIPTPFPGADPLGHSFPLLNLNKKTPNDLKEVDDGQL